MNTIQLWGQDRVTGELNQSSTGTKSQALPAAGNWSTWSAYHCDPRCSLLHPPHSHFPAQEARAEHGGGGCSTPRHYHQHRPGSGVLPGSTGSWVSHAPPDITGAPRPSLSRVWSASLTGESWGPGPGHITAHFPTALGRVSQGSRSEH